MNKKEIADYFNRKAECWDEHQRQDTDKIERILDEADTREGMEVLDVACGTGVLFPHLLKRGIKVTAIDIATGMCEKAKDKYPEVEVINADVEEYDFKGRKFDRIFVYNAFPHFISPENLIRTLSGLLKEDGVLTIAHSRGREMINHHHMKISENVSRSLISADECMRIITRYLDKGALLSDEDIYLVSGIRHTEKKQRSIS